MIDHCSYVQLINSCQIKARKKISLIMCACITISFFKFNIRQIKLQQVVR